ncbi:lipoxygenase [Nostoc sp. UCD121]|nr:lipoxygenase [Nostoc sp. UCD120]MBC1279956.1 lipoxygenase [Nostoc sp. UCD121]MBC1294624.1 lipoxygenase [Nostoc sp. UCD122]
MPSRNSNSGKEKYQWIKQEERYIGAPPYVVGLPKGEGFTPWKIIIFNFVTLTSALGLIFAQFIHLIAFVAKKIFQGKQIFLGTADLGLLSFFSTLNNWNKLQDFHSFFQPWTFLPKPKIAQDWHKDEAFGDQRLNGLNPAFLRKCQPEDISESGKFPVTEEILKPVLGNDFTLASAFVNNRLYLVDYKLFDGILNPGQQDQIGKYAYAPLCLLYVNDHKKLVPVAIQVQQKLESNNNTSNPIWTPKSSPQSWLAAKMVVSAIDAAYQGVVSHLYETHLIVEICTVSTYRTLSQDHILYQLLKPHFFNTIVMNFMARILFLGRGGFFDVTGALGYTGSNELLHRAYTGEGLNTSYQGEPWEFYKKALPYDLEARDVKDIPGYYYRDDALLAWDTIKEYVSNILKGHYPDPQSLEQDEQLQAWKNELISPQAGDLKGLLSCKHSEQLTGTLNNLDCLIEIVTTIIFTATTQHAAVNFPQYNNVGWIPSMAFAIYQPLSYLVKSGDGSQELDVVQLLPNRWETLKQIVLVRTLSLAPPYTSKSLLTLENPFQDELDKNVFTKFQKQLSEIECKISDRNTALVKSGQKPYTYLLPSQIPQSIAI